MNILISGAGVAGPTLAYWLNRYGLNPTIVETAPALRTGGYIIDFWGAGFEIAERMGLGQLKQAGYMVREVRVVNEHGRRVAGFPVSVFVRATKGRYVSIRRGDLAALIFKSTQPAVETIFGDAIVQLDPHYSGVRVSFESGVTRDFDLVIGADGLHSRVRELAFGPEPGFERYLGYKVAAWEDQGYRPRDELVYVMYTEVGQQMARFSMRDDRTMFLAIFADAQAALPSNTREQRAALRARFGASGWECRRIIDRLDGVEELYFDRVSQIVIPSPPGWARGRIALVGDAASCVSLLGGQGSALAMTAAYLLAGELHTAGRDYASAYTRYERRFAPFVADKQRMARRFAGAFAPASKLSMVMRNQIMNLLTISAVARLLAGRSFTDAIVLPQY